MTTKTLRIFCSYSHEDEAYLDELRTSLRGLERQGLVEWWHDREIVPGWEWDEAIDKNLRSAEVILLLVTPDFMSSDYVFESEIARAIERHKRSEAHVIPVIVRPADWEWAPFGRLQALPKDARPITTWTNQDEAWLDVVRGIRKAVEKLTSETSDTPTDEQGGYLPLRYREGVELAWADEKLDEREVEWLRDLTNRIGLSPSTAAGIEREVMGDTIEALVERQEPAPSPTVAVPDLGGQEVSQASITLANEGLELGYQNQVPNHMIPAGKIIKQSPEAGKEVDAGSSVSIWVSSGPQRQPLLAGHWWVPALRGLVLAIFGATVLVVTSLVSLGVEPGFGLYKFGAIMMMVDGVFAIIGAISSPYGRQPLLVQGIISGLAGLLTWRIADPTALLNPASYSMGSWAIVIGIVWIIATIRLKQEIRSLWLMGTSGVLLVVFGILMVWPRDFGWLLTGLPVLASGITLITFAFKARNREKWGNRATTLQG
jgi:hypothetical protein